MSEPGSVPEAVTDSDPIKRWTAKRKAAVVLDLIKGKVTAADVARKFDLTVAEVQQWQEDFLAAGQERMRCNPRDTEQQFDAERSQLHAKIGELTLEIDAAKKQLHAQLKEQLGVNS